MRVVQIKKGLAALREVLDLVWVEASSFVKVRLLFALVLITASSALVALGPVALKLIVDRLTGQSAGLIVSLALLIAAYTLTQWFARTVGEVRGLVYARAERRMARTLRERLFAHVLDLPLRFHLDRQTGGVTQTLSNGIEGYQMVVHTLVFSILPVFAELGTILIVLSGLRQPVFLLFFCAALVCYALAFGYAARRTMKAARAASNADVAASAEMTDSILNYETVKYFAAEALIRSKVGVSLVESEQRWVQYYRQFAVNGILVATIFAVFLSSTVVHAAHEVQSGRMTIGTFVLINSYMLQVVRPVEMFGYAIQFISRGMAYLEKMVELFHEKTEATSPSEETPEEIKNNWAGIARPAEVAFENVCLSYRPDRPVLRGVSFKIPAGKTLGVVGSSGAGKSTLVRLAVRLMEPNAGRVLLDGVAISEMELPALRRAVAVVPQDTVLFNDTIGYNIAFGKPGSTPQEVEQAARLAHLHDFIRSLPDGYDTRVGERGVKLSGGERQRVSIARAVLKGPRMYIFDEATSSLDSATEREILRNLREIARLSTTLIIAHRLSTVAHADEIVVLEQGQIVERGTHVSLLRENSRYASLWKAQEQGSVAAA